MLKNWLWLWIIGVSDLTVSLFVLAVLIIMMIWDGVGEWWDNRKGRNGSKTC